MKIKLISKNMTPEILFNANKDVEENLILIVSKNIKLFAKKFFRRKESSLILRHIE